MKTIPYTLKSPLILTLFLLLPFTFSLHATQVTTPTTSNKLARIKKIKKCIVIYPELDIDAMLDKGIEMIAQGCEIGKQGLQMEKKGAKMKKRGYKVQKNRYKIEKRVGKLWKEGNKMRKKGREVWKEGYKMQKKGRKILLDTIRKIEAYNNDESSKETWEMINKGSKMIAQGEKIYEEGYREKKRNLMIIGCEMVKQGCKVRKKGIDALKKKYTTIMTGHKANSTCYWENLASIIRCF